MEHTKEQYKDFKVYLSVKSAQFLLKKSKILLDISIVLLMWQLSFSFGSNKMPMFFIGPVDLKSFSPLILQLKFETNRAQEKAIIWHLFVFNVKFC